MKKNKVLSDVPLQQVDHPVYRFQGLVLSEVDGLKNYLLGRVLTVIDAVVADQEQRKAQKDVIKEIFYHREYCTNNILSWFADYLRSLDELDTEAQKFADEHWGITSSSLPPSPS